MTSESRTARWAGLVYLVVVVTGFFSLGYVPGKIATAGDPQALLNNIVAHEYLVRAGIASFIIEQAAFLLLPLLLFRLFGGMHRGAAVAMVALAVTAVPIALVGVAHRLDALQLLTDASGLPLDTAHAMARFSLNAWSHDIFVASLFWGLWLFPFGFLVIRSGLLPRLFGVLLILGGMGYLVDVGGDLLLPGYADMAFSNYVHLPAALGEVGTCLWLLIVGARVRSADQRTNPGSSTIASQHSTERPA
ncbi:hypothetical protein B0E47_00225 [Rhodanobacter sp. B05]|uniref:DUF4386 domain-containing protein n=1 Tax=Rhodanobacter sp. B05 TaxID=1945859 RepID=UPI000984F5CA|nr:DUF4386 domain-containing protein [Rhodanobacter sp. B05]OOG61138.1 hypothetical protein B0E47_00225 [Rhodanobacter sp. B05]